MRRASRSLPRRRPPAPRPPRRSSTVRRPAPGRRPPRPRPRRIRRALTRRRRFATSATGAVRRRPSTTSSSPNGVTTARGRPNWPPPSRRKDPAPRSSIACTSAACTGWNGRPVRRRRMDRRGSRPSPQKRPRRTMPARRPARRSRTAARRGLTPPAVTGGARRREATSLLRTCRRSRPRRRPQGRLAPRRLSAAVPRRSAAMMAAA